MQTDSIKADLLREMESYFGDDQRRIDHARRVTGYAERLMALEGGVPAVVLGAGVLHDIGIHQAEKKHGSPGGKFQEIESPPIARGILSKLGFPLEQVDEICEIIGHHHSPGVIDTVNFRVLYDADWLVNLGHEYDIADRKKLSNIIERVFLTESGRALATEIYLNEK